MQNILLRRQSIDDEMKLIGGRSLTLQVINGVRKNLLYVIAMQSLISTSCAVLGRQIWDTIQQAPNVHNIAMDLDKVPSYK